MKSSKNIRCQKVEKINIGTLWELKSVIDDIFFAGKLKYNFYTDAKDMSINEPVFETMYTGK